MKEYCLIGHPLGHSISPQIHEKLFSLSGHKGSYRLKDIDPENFDEGIESLRTLVGFNVTIPYKQRILPFLSQIDERAKVFGAVNTVKCENGRFIGYNTDSEGFRRALHHAGIPLQGRVLLCGAGGVAHMMACEAIENGCSLVIATPMLSEARSCADELSVRYPEAEISPAALAYLSGSFDLLLNGTPSGMFPDVKSMPVPLPVARSARAVFDAVYNPGETRLLKEARAGGAKTLGGLTMLIWQAAAAQEIWTGAHFEEKDIYSLCGEMAELLKAGN